VCASKTHLVLTICLQVQAKPGLGTVKTSGFLWFLTCWTASLVPGDLGVGVPVTLLPIFFGFSGWVAASVVRTVGTVFDGIQNNPDDVPVLQLFPSLLCQRRWS